MVYKYTALGLINNIDDLSEPETYWSWGWRVRKIGADFLDSDWATPSEAFDAAEAWLDDNAEPGDYWVDFHGLLVDKYSDQIITGPVHRGAWVTVGELVT